MRCWLRGEPSDRLVIMYSRKVANDRRNTFAIINFINIAVTHFIAFCHSITTIGLEECGIEGCNTRALFPSTPRCAERSSDALHH